LADQANAANSKNADGKERWRAAAFDGLSVFFFLLSSSLISLFASSNNQKKLAPETPSPHPDVVLLVHQGTDLVNREPFEKGKEKKRGEREGEKREEKEKEAVRSGRRKSIERRGAYSSLLRLVFSPLALALFRSFLFSEKNQGSTYLTMVAGVLSFWKRGPP
jgi:hypothetical protein